MTIIASDVKNEIFKISGNHEDSNLNVVRRILHYYYGNPDHTNYITDLVRQGQDVRYAIDDSKLKALGWEPRAQFDTALEEIVNYYKNNFIW